MSVYSSFTPGSATRPVTKIELSVRCRNLINRDLLSKSDPFVVMFGGGGGGGRKHEIGRTEVIRDNLSPVFAKKFVVDYFFEERQIVLFQVFDSDDDAADLSRHDALGGVQVSLGEIVSSPGSELTRSLKKSTSSSSSTITVRSEEIVDNKDIVTFQIRGNKLDKKDFFGKSDPFLNISRQNPDASWTLVMKTEVIKNTLDPSWRPFDISVSLLCNGDYSRKIKFECVDWDSDGGHDHIGDCVTTLDELQQGSAKTLDLINLKKKAKKGSSYKNSGNLYFANVAVSKRYSFLEYIKGGTDINFTVAVDFTGSNGHPRHTQSLHYINPNHYVPNQYQQAIQSVGEIISDYDADHLFPSLGFGARLPPDGRVSHEFYLNGHPTNPHCQGVEGIMMAYRQTLDRVELYGPTNFSPVINHVSRFAAADSQSGKNYFVLLIITDGVITDFSETVTAIINASSLPMSIIIVGVGNDDFGAMDALDADDRLLSNGRQKAARDIVQFVPFRDFNGGTDFEGNKARLAKAVLAEVPDQLTGFMHLKGLKPGPGRPERPQPPASEAPHGSASYPGANPSVPPTQTGAAPYPSGPPGGAQYPGQASPYPNQGSPYPNQGCPNPAYPSGTSASQNGPPYPTPGASGSAPYPNAGGVPYPSPGAAAPYPAEGPYPAQAPPPYPPLGGSGTNAPTQQKTTTTHNPFYPSAPSMP